MLYEDEDQYEDPDIYSRLLDCLGGISSVLKTQETSKEDALLLSNSLANLWEVMKKETTEYDDGNKLSFEAMISSIQIEVGQRSTVGEDSCDEETAIGKEVRERIQSNEVVISGVANKSPKEEFPGAEMLQLPDGGNDDVVSDVADKAKSPEFEILKPLMTSGDSISDVLNSPDAEMFLFPDEERLSLSDAELLKSTDDKMMKSPCEKMMKTPDVEMLRVEEMATNKTKLIENECYHEDNEENDEQAKEKIEQKRYYGDNDGNDEQVMEKEKLHVGETDNDKTKLFEYVCYHEDNEENDEQVKEENDLRTEERDNDMVNLNIPAYYKDKDRNEKQGKKTNDLFDVLESTEKPHLKGIEKWRYPPHCKIRMVLSQKTVSALLDTKTAYCPSDESPDDMLLGTWLKRLDIPIIHSPLFHQARPDDYAGDYLGHQEEPISFHKHWMVDPYKVYNQWLKEKDIAKENQPEKPRKPKIIIEDVHDEL